MRRLEDIVGEIRKDMIKAHANGSGGIRETIQSSSKRCMMRRI